MKVIFGLGKITSDLKGCVLAIGIFDGLHLGHQALIKNLVRRAKALNQKSVVLTFAPHPVYVLHPRKYLPYIVSLSYRLKLIEELGVDVCIVHRFTKSFSHLTPEQFIKKYLIGRISPREIYVGDDFHFGRNRRGDVDDFQNAGRIYGFKVDIVSSIKSAKSKISSTHIRHLIQQGQLAEAQKLLGRPVSLLGKVIHGDGRGKNLGFPTVNICTHEEVLPPIGVYAVEVEAGRKKYQGMANVGFRPSFKSPSESIGIEVHIFHFDRDLYGQEILVKFFQKIRNEKKFSSNEALIAQLKEDEHRILTYFRP
jgi:riboflavin kinase / FMN adenylyltransferase